MGLGQMYAAEICRIMVTDPDGYVRIAAVSALGNMDERGSAFVEDIMYLVESFVEGQDGEDPTFILACLKTFNSFGQLVHDKLNADYLDMIETGDFSPELKKEAAALNVSLKALQ